eukprot:5662731-Pleurochrysis_carterae.AAC.1
MEIGRGLRFGDSRITSRHTTRAELGTTVQRRLVTGGWTEPLRAIEPHIRSVDGGGTVKDRLSHERRRQY